MYKVEWKDTEGQGCEEEVETLDLAMLRSKELNAFVTISGNGMEIVGRFGADSIKDGVCPDGVPYTWMKRRNS
jgi:hypothetical protein